MSDSVTGRSIHKIVSDYEKIDGFKPPCDIEQAGWWGRFGSFQINKRRELEKRIYELEAEKKDWQEAVSINASTITLLADQKARLKERVAELEQAIKGWREDYLRDLV